MGVDLEQEDDSTGFLGVNLERDLKTVLLYMKNAGLIQCIINEVVVDGVISKGKFTPSEDNPVVMYENDESTSGIFSYRRFVWMLLYLYMHNSTYVSLDANIITG